MKNLPKEEPKKKKSQENKLPPDEYSQEYRPDDDYDG